MNAETADLLCRRIQSSTVTYENPFKLGVVDHFLPPDILEQVISAFPSASDPTWETSIIDSVEQKRRSTWSSIYDVPSGLQGLVTFMNSSLFLNQLTEILGIPKLLPDPYFTGGGLNESFKGDFLDVHIDGNYHDASGLNRRVNAILYLNPTWEKSWGGCLGMYADKGQRLIREFSPKNNRLVVFDTSDSSFHGYPDPIQCPETVSRRSLILYYYTKEPQVMSETTVLEPHSALWVKKELKDRKGKAQRSSTDDLKSDLRPSHNRSSCL